MRTIDMQSWSRRKHYELFGSFNHPHFGMTVNMDLTAFRSYQRKHGISFTVAVMYVISRAANSIPEFRYRIRDESVIEHDIVHPSATILVNENEFSFCTVEYTGDFSKFAEIAAKQIAHVKENLTLEDKSGQDDLLFMTSIPWVSFTSFMHPMQLHPADSVPRFAWGKFFEQDQKIMMPLAVQGHHALMDGIHMGRYYTMIQELLFDPQEIL